MKVRALKRRAIPRMLFATRIRAYDRAWQEMTDALCASLMEGIRGIQAWTASPVSLPPEHEFKEGDYATRDGTDVQLVTYANDRYADFRCIKAPRTGWIGVGEVEHNGQWKYTPLTAEEARGMGAVLQAAPEPA